MGVEALIAQYDRRTTFRLDKDCSIHDNGYNGIGGFVFLHAMAP